MPRTTCEHGCRVDLAGGVRADHASAERADRIRRMVPELGRAATTTEITALVERTR